MTTEQWSSYLHRNIPLSEAMAVRVVEVSDRRVEISVPLEPNLNHRQTAFGGSIVSLAILSSWTWLVHRLESERIAARVVIQSISGNYNMPIDSDFRSICESPSEEAWKAFLRAIKRKGMGRIVLDSQVINADAEAAVFRGEFVAVIRNDDGTNDGMPQ